MSGLADWNFINQYDSRNESLISEKGHCIREMKDAHPADITLGVSTIANCEDLTLLIKLDLIMEREEDIRIQLRELKERLDAHQEQLDAFRREMKTGPVKLLESWTNTK